MIKHTEQGDIIHLHLHLTQKEQATRPTSQTRSFPSSKDRNPQRLKSPALTQHRNQPHISPTPTKPPLHTTPHLYSNENHTRQQNPAVRTNLNNTAPFIEHQDENFMPTRVSDALFTYQQDKIKTCRNSSTYHMIYAVCNCSSETLGNGMSAG